MSKLKITMVRINTGAYLTAGSYSNGFSSHYRINKGVNGEGEKTPLSKWEYFPGLLDVISIERKTADKREYTHWTLVDPELMSEKIPATLETEQLHYDSDYYWGDMKHLGSLYEKAYDVTPGGWVDEEFEVVQQTSYDVDVVDPPVDFKVYKIGNNSYIGKDVYGAHPKTDTIEQLLYPDIIQQYRPCHLTSQETYNIIRHCIKNNIDPTRAEITSDYDFCFTVKKKVALKPFTITTEVKKKGGGSYVRPRFSSKTTSHKTVDLFEMTHGGKKYGGYTVVKGFKGENQEDLKNNIDAYLTDLMVYINMPIHECENCKGLGSIVVKGYKLNGGEGREE